MIQTQLEKQIIQCLREEGVDQKTQDMVEAGLQELKRFTATDILEVIQRYTNEHYVLDKNTSEKMLQEIAKNYSYTK